ncbi:MAG: hypothetical protein RL268_178 [Pseudomonadota bacterium]|jgi:hypothetical protein
MTLHDVIATMPRAERIGALAFAIIAPLIFAGIWIGTP